MNDRNQQIWAWQRREQSAIEKALRRAYQLGQNYMHQADSESYSQNKKADDTAATFEALIRETCPEAVPFPKATP